MARLRFLHLLIVGLGVLGAAPALAQSSLLQAGPQTQGHAPVYLGGGFPQAFVGDSGPAGGGGPGLGFSEMLLTARGSGSAPYSAQGTGPFNTNFCDYDGPTTGAYHYFCFSPNGQGAAGIIAFGFANGATALPLIFKYNGSSYAFPFTSGGALGPGTTVAGHIAIWNNATGTLLADGGALTFGSLSGSLGCGQTPAMTGDVTSPAGSCGNTIASGAVTSAKMAAGAAAANIGTLSGDLAGSTLPATTIAAGAVTGAKIAANTVADANMLANTISYASQNQAVAGTVVGNPANSTANKQDMAMPSCSLASQFLQWVTGTGFICGSVATSSPTSPVRQTVAGGPVLLSGPAGGPNFLPATSGSLNLTSQNVSSSYPLVVTAANGFGAPGPVDAVGESTSNITWSSLPSSSTLYLYVTVNSDGTLTPGYSVLQPTYEFGGTPSTTSGQFTFNIGEMRGYMGNGSTAPQAYIVFVGQAVTGSSTITSTVAYAYNGEYTSALNAVPNGSAVTVSHNLGVAPVAYNTIWTLVCITTNLGYPVGAELPMGNISSSYGQPAQIAPNNSTSLLSTLSASSDSTWYEPSYNGSSQTTITLADWNVRAYAKRNF